MTSTIIVMILLLYIAYSMSVFLLGRGYSHSELDDVINNLQIENAMLKQELSKRSVEEIEHKPILNIDGLDIYEYVVYKLEKLFYESYLMIDVVSVHFVKIDNHIHVHFYGNPYKENTYHPYYSKFADKIKIVGIDEENTFRHTLFLETKIYQYQKEWEDFDYVCKKAKESVGEE